MSLSLPIYDERASSLRRDGSRNHVHPADVHGRFARVRTLAFGALIALLAALPWLDLGGHPALFLDIETGKFYLFGNTFNAQDVWLSFFLFSGAGFALIFVTAVWGRVWCGYACPHTVFLEGVFRPIERLLEGPRQARLQRNRGPLTLDKLLRKSAKHAIYVLLAFLIAHIVLSYFVSLPRLYRMVLARPSEHPATFVWATGLTGLLYFNFSWFREQLCLIVCPYGRLQSVLTDRNSLVIGYDKLRGEPRGKASDERAGACVDCQRCVVVCPTGIDIRNGLQMDCVGCARCIDACDEIMDKLERPRGLIRYDSQNGLARLPSRTWRPRIWLYAVLGAVGMCAATLAFSQSHGYEANLLRLPGVPFVREGNQVRNAFEIHIVNKRGATVTLTVAGNADPALRYTIAPQRIQLASLASQRVMVFVSFDRGRVQDGASATIRIHAEGGEERVLVAKLIAPK
jgi:cytochrome c oxidase accessory protein FixG